MADVHVLSDYRVNGAVVSFPLTLRLISRDDPQSIRWLDAGLRRLEAMSRRFNGDAKSLLDEVWEAIAKKSPVLGFWVAVEGETIVAHLLARIQQMDGEWVCWIVQAESDQPLDRTFREVVTRTIDDWVGAFNRTYAENKVQIHAVKMGTPRVNEAWTRHSGFVLERAIYTRPVRN